MIIVTTDFIDEKELKIIGLVKGSTIQSKHVGKDIASGLKTMVGGELKGYTDMMNQARDIALNRMIDEANTLGCDAIISVRFSTSAIMQGAAECMAYGTGVSFK